MRRIKSAVFVAFVLLFVSFQSAAVGGNFISDEQVDLVKLLAPPSANDSAQTKAELDELMDIQHRRTPQAEAAAVADVDVSIFRFADILGSKLTPANLSVAVRFFERLREDESHIVASAKKTWNRSRPFLLDSELKPCCPHQSDSPSYPSGHASFGQLNAVILANMVPEKRKEIFDRGEQYGRNRMVCGVHFRSDVEAGRIAATVIAAIMMQNSAFQEEYARARADVRKALGYE